MDPLFSEVKIKNMLVQNRFVRSATWEGMANEDGSITEQLIALYEQLAKAEIGLIITGHAYVRADGKATPRQIGIYKDELISGLKRLVNRVHSLGGKIMIQLSHSGIFGRKSLSGYDPINPSSISKKQIEALIEAFVRAALRAKEAGFDGIQLHAAHGYLISQFFSPLFNSRADDYGGSLKNRTRFASSIIEAIKRDIGEDLPIFVKINCQDFLDGGLTVKDSIEIAKILIDHGTDALEISGGILTSKDKGPCRRENGPYFKKEAALFKKHLKVPIILVGGIRSYDVSKQIIEENVADLISMSRPFICEANLIKRWRSGDKRPSLCRSDNLCLTAVKKKEYVRCFRRYET